MGLMRLFQKNMYIGVLQLIPISPIFFYFHHLSQLFGLISPNLGCNTIRLDKTIPNIYIYWGIVADTNLWKFYEKCWKIFGQISPILWYNIDGLDETIPKIYICLGQICCYHYLLFLTRNSLFLTRNSLFLLETRFCYSKLAFLTRNSLFLLETHFCYSKLAFSTRNSLF